MPFLMVNLADPADCRRGIQELKRCVAAMRHPFGGRPGQQACGNGGGVAGLPLGQKLRRIRQRGIWQHLATMARLPDQPRSLTEWDVALGLATNKMRSLKAIMAKLEHRFALRFLVPAAAGGDDAAGNPRYGMPPRVRGAILRLADAEPGDADREPAG